MPIRISRKMTDEKSNRLRLRGRVRLASFSGLVGACLLPFCTQLQAQDLLLKEYIYLNERLLAVERQPVTQSALWPQDDSEMTAKFQFALHFPVNAGAPGLKDGSSSFLLFNRNGLPTRGGGIGKDPLLGSPSSPENTQTAFVAVENFAFQSYCHLTPPEIAGIPGKRRER